MFSLLRVPSKYTAGAPSQDSSEHSSNTSALLLPDSGGYAILSHLHLPYKNLHAQSNYTTTATEATDITETDRSDMEDYFSAESSVIADSSSGDEDDSDDEYLTDNEDGMSLSCLFLNNISSVILATQGHADTKIMKEDEDYMKDDSRDAFERAKKATMFGNELEPEIHSLHRYLKHFIISRGSKLDGGSSEKTTFTEYQVTNAFFSPVQLRKTNGFA